MIADDSLSSEPRRTPSAFEIARAFLVIGCLAFGGQGGLLALLNRDLVGRRRWLSEEEITEAFTYVQLLPGAVVVQVAAYLGYKLRGWSGAVSATTAFLLPSMAAMLVFAATYQRLVLLAGVQAALNGLTAAVVGLLALAAYKQGSKIIKNSMGLVVAVVVYLLSLRWHLNPALLVVAAGLIGIVIEGVTKGEKPSPIEPGETGATP